MSETGSSAFERWRDSDDATECGISEAWNAALEWAAGQVEAEIEEATRPIQEALSARVETWLYRHDDRVFVRWGKVEEAVRENIRARAAKIREGIA